MFRLICRRPNASTSINGITFAPQEDGSMVSDPVSEEVAADFRNFPGYEIIPASGSAPRGAEGGSKPAGTGRGRRSATAPQGGGDQAPPVSPEGDQNPQAPQGGEGEQTPEAPQGGEGEQTTPAGEEGGDQTPPVDGETETQP